MPQSKRKRGWNAASGRVEMAFSLRPRAKCKSQCCPKGLARWRLPSLALPEVRNTRCLCEVFFCVKQALGHTWCGYFWGWWISGMIFFWQRAEKHFTRLGRHCSFQQPPGLQEHPIYLMESFCDSRHESERLLSECKRLNHPSISLPPLTSRPKNLLSRDMMILPDGRSSSPASEHQKGQQDEYTKLLVHLESCLFSQDLGGMLWQQTDEEKHQAGSCLFQLEHWVCGKPRWGHDCAAQPCFA